MTTDAYGNPPVVLSDWARAEMERQGLRLAGGDHDWDDDPDWFCTASGCVEDIRDSHGECVHCGEPVVLVVRKSASSGGHKS